MTHEKPSKNEDELLRAPRRELLRQQRASRACARRATRESERKKHRT